MLDIVLNLLSILGIVLLIILGVVLFILLLVLFFPFTYRARGQKNDEEFSAQVRADWLFGFLRLRFAYPEPGRLIVKVLFFKVFDSGGTDKETEKSEQPKDEKKKKTVGTKKEISEESPKEKTAAENASKDDAGKADSAEKPASSDETADSETADGTQTDSKKAPSEPQEKRIEGLRRKISAKYDKIKYTIQKICDRIRHILDNISFYRKLLTDENTRELFKHACFRVGRILKHIRPRKLKADILFGAASPDTTGYIYGAYCMLSPKFGKDIHVTPDFEQAILEGRLYAAGHITVIQILIHGISLLLDKRLRIFLRKLKKHGESIGNSSRMEANNGR